jgi:uncharacterized protein
LSPQGKLMEVIRHWLGKANESLAAAEDEMRANRLSFSVNRLYYACFYAVSAFLLQQRLQFKKHSGVRASFHKYLVKPGFVSIEHAKLYEELFEARQRGDYIELVSFEEAQVEEWLVRVREFVDTVRSLIKDL